MNAKERERRFRYIGEIGCICCRRYGHKDVPCDVHHLNLDEHAGQKRRGDEYTIGLCTWHHRGFPQPTAEVGPSLKHEPRRFRHVFGSDDELLEDQNRLLALKEALRV